MSPLPSGLLGSPSPSRCGRRQLALGIRTPSFKADMRGSMPRLAKPIAAEDLVRITVPTSLIWGRHDVGVPIDVATAANSRYGWPLHVIDGARADPAFEQPTAFLDALRKALAPAGAITPPPLPFQLADPAMLRSWLADAGLTDISV
jgi:pimeloyl-ACP methyl ester carboxylesterase